MNRGAEATGLADCAPANVAPNIGAARRKGAATSFQKERLARHGFVDAARSHATPCARAAKDILSNAFPEVAVGPRAPRRARAHHMALIGPATVERS